MVAKRMKKIGKTIFAFSFPPLYSAIEEWRAQANETFLNKSLHATIASGLVSALTFFGSLMLEETVAHYQEKIIRKQDTIKIDGEQKLEVIYRENVKPTKNISIRQFITPLEVIVRIATDTFPKEKFTEISGKIDFRGINYEVNGFIQGWKTPSEISKEDIYQKIKSVSLSENAQQYFLDNNNL
jgi:hypothetical protein